MGYYKHRESAKLCTRRGYFLIENTHKPVIILGAGGHAKVIADALLQSGHKILGFVIPDKKQETSFYGFSVLSDDDIDTFQPDSVVLANGIGALPYQGKRRALAARMRDQGYTFTTIIHPSAVVASDVELAEGVQVMAGSVIQSGTKIGIDSIINTGVLLDHDCKIAERCHLAPGVVCSGGVNIGEGTHVGTGVLVIQNISIGKNSVVAAGSVIYKNVLSNETFIQVRHRRVEAN